MDRNENEYLLFPCKYHLMVLLKIILVRNASFNLNLRYPDFNNIMKKILMWNWLQAKKDSYSWR